MREPLKDNGRLEHMLEMALNLQEAKYRHSYEDILNDRILFYGLTKMTEIIERLLINLLTNFESPILNFPGER